MSEARRFAKNTMWNLAGQVGPLVIAVIATPIVLRELGTERVGILTLAWAAVGYFNLFDLGLPRVLTQAMSPSIASGDQRRLSEVSQAGLVTMTAMGLAGAAVMAGITPWLINSALNIPAELKAEATTSMYVLSACIPFLVGTSGLRGVLEAHQEFGTAALLRLPYAAFNYIAPLVTVGFSRSLVPIVILLLVGRILTWAAHVVVCVRRYPYLTAPTPLRLSTFSPLLRLSGWMTASGLVAPFLYNVDRFVIGSTLTLAAVTYYVMPFELVTKLMLIPAAIIGVLFPAFAAVHLRDSAKATDLLERAIRLMAVIMFPAVLLLVALAPEILKLWLGVEMATQGSRVAQVLAIGVFINSIAQVQYTILQAAGRPDITAKLQALELPLYAALLWFLTPRMGVNGVAIAWVIRMAMDCVLMTVFVAKEVPEARSAMSYPTSLALALTAACAFPMLFASTGGRIGAALAVGLIAAPPIWHRGLRASERAEIIRLVRMPFRRAHAVR